MSKFTSYRIEPEQAGLLLEDYLKQILQFSGRRVQRLTRQKGILLNNRAAFLQKKLKAGDQLKIKIETDEGYGVEPEAGPVEILQPGTHLQLIGFFSGGRAKGLQQARPVDQ